MKLSVVIPAYNEEGSLATTLRRLDRELQQQQIEYELLVVNDGSKDRTAEVLADLGQEIPSLRSVYNPGPHGFGMAVRRGLLAFSGDAVAVVMADCSDNPKDLVRFWRRFEQGDVDCVFGTRFCSEATVKDYPRLKYVLNRTANKFIQILFALGYNDTTNAFKLYSRDAIEGLKPFLSHHFNLTVELPLKSIIRGYKFAVLTNDWTNRSAGEAKLKIKEMGSRYLFIILYCFIERWLSRGDYNRIPKELKSRSSSILVEPQPSGKT